jgi:predicted metal-dependent hydrolase
MSLMLKTRCTFAVMVGTFLMMCLTVAGAATMPDADMLSKATPPELLAWAVVIEAGVIVAMAGVIIQAYRNRVKALERQVEACRECAKEIAEARRRMRG